MASQQLFSSRAHHLFHLGYIIIKLVVRAIQRIVPGIRCSIIHVVIMSTVRDDALEHVFCVEPGPSTIPSRHGWHNTSGRRSASRVLKAITICGIIRFTLIA
jgi:hypothetical protein